MKKTNADFRTAVYVQYFLFKMLVVGGGILALYLGYELYLAGVGGKASLVVDAKGVGGQLVNAAPGLFFAVGGVVILVTATIKGSPDRRWWWSRWGRTNALEGLAPRRPRYDKSCRWGATWAN